MFAYIVRRLGSTLVVLFGITIVSFLLIYAIPADPARIIVGPKAPMSVVIAVRHQLGLDQPLYVQYWRYLVGLLHGNLGTSYTYNLPVSQMILQRLWPTLELALGCWIAELIIGVPLGIYTARHARKLGDYVMSILALIFLAMPVFWLGLILLYWFAFKIPIFPLGGFGGIQYLILPSLTYGLTGAAFYIRLLKSQMLEVLSQDYVRTARAKGASERRVTWRHVLRNALIPVVTYGGVDFSYLISGVVLIESVFSWNGLGQLAYTAIQNLDTPVILGTVLVVAVAVTLVNLIVDLIYGVIDPRIRYE
ncbi:ABC transporter permease [Alicyclobacillus cycloheptanicus]|uniref:Peptide/nickel transport system permease protein n=1 Tax=Alicyclobacillus cycloheptanicus TaxID=1457 RepID=A0ABT9XGZ6_9BACL|nr:ABC transporter permease [Alicyclobacillus cycloheptanicus]MDQ0189016.1 peptide/nickel transport system permease protein [Alicyclobacillus cycloheptanicus]WDM01646.1 ABC transporter permease [Alicyclobacillus cycloheptanicus]